jgi:glycosyltransferase involved in cell wall biosynthesis
VADSKDDAGVTAVVCAYNEADRISEVLEVLVTYSGFSEVIVVDDGSTDDTAVVAKRYPVTYLRLNPNQGKGRAMDAGVKASTTPVIFFADADIKGLTHDVIARTVGPVVDGEVEMFVAMRSRAIYYLRFLMAFIPLLGGERAVTKRLWAMLPDRYKDRFRIEAGLNFYAVHYGHGLRFHVFTEVTQTVKERKYGFWRGVKQRARMFRDVGVASWDLQFEDAPVTFRTRRSAAVNAASSVVGLIAGLLVVLAAYLGPASVIGRLFAEELAEDPNAPLVRFLLFTANGLGVTALGLIGATLIMANVLLFTLSLLRLVRMGTERAAG